MRALRRSARAKFLRLMGRHPEQFRLRNALETRRKLEASAYRYCDAPQAHRRPAASPEAALRKSKAVACAHQELQQSLHRVEAELAAQQRLLASRRGFERPRGRRSPGPLAGAGLGDSLARSTAGLKFEAFKAKPRKDFIDVVKLMRLGLKLKVITNQAQ